MAIPFTYLFLYIGANTGIAEPKYEIKLLLTAVLSKWGFKAKNNVGFVFVNFILNR